MRIQEQCGVLDFFSRPVPTNATDDERYKHPLLYDNILLLAMCFLSKIGMLLVNNRV